MNSKVGDVVPSYARVVCAICGHKGHFLELHVSKDHGLSLEDYQNAYPSMPVLSAAAKAKLDALDAETRNKMIDYNIEATFGVRPLMDKKTVKGFMNPHPSTPTHNYDPHYHFDPMFLGLVLYTLGKPKEVLMLTGPTGSGKSSCPEQIAIRLNLPYYRVNFDNEITRSDFVGQDRLRGEETVFDYGILPRAMREGSLLVLDEIDMVNPGIGAVLQAVLEGGSLTITETGEVIIPHPNFRIIATGNTVGQGDETGLYNGTQPQNFAAIDRYKSVYYVDYPKPEVEKEIITRKTGIKEADLLNKLTRTAGLIRESFKKQETRTTMSTRTIVNIAEKINDFGSAKIAFEIGYLNKLNEEDKEFCREIVQRVLGF